MSFGLALAGGGCRGAAHVGVITALSEYNLLPSSIAGTSAGGIVAGLFACGKSPKELQDIVVQLSKHGHGLIDPNIKGFVKAVGQLITKRPLTMSGLIKGDRLEKYLASITNFSNIKTMPIKTVITAVDINSGNTIAYTSQIPSTKPIDGLVWETNIPLYKAMRASASVPAVFCPKFLGPLCLVDGGVTDMLPVNVLMSAGEKNILAVDISETYLPPQHHNIMDITSHSLTIMSNKLMGLTSTGERLLLKPNLPEKANLFAFDQMVACMDAGYDAAIKMMPTIKRYFQ